MGKKRSAPIAPAQTTLNKEMQEDKYTSRLMTKSLKFQNTELENAHAQVERQRGKLEALNRLIASGLKQQNERITKIEELKKDHEQLTAKLCKRIEGLEKMLHDSNSE